MEVLYHWRRPPTTRQVQLIGKKEFVAATLDLKHEAFIVHIAALSVNLGNEMYPLRKAQIANLKANEAPTEVPSKYPDFADVFLLKFAAQLSKYRISNHAIELVDDW